MRVLQTFFAVVLFLTFISPVSAQDIGGEDVDFAQRLEWAEKMNAIRPAREQVNAAIDRYVSALSPEEAEVYRTALQRILNYKALEKISVDAFAEVYTEAELKAMVEYYSMPEAQSASEKSAQYAEIVYPEIVRMLDKAMMRVKTGGEGP